MASILSAGGRADVDVDLERVSGMRRVTRNQISVDQISEPLRC